MTYFVLTTVAGPAWDHSRDRRDQDGWDEHAAFMDGLVDEGLVFLGGPLDATRALLVVEAADEHDVRARLAEDPWQQDGTLTIASLEHWTIWLDGRRARPES